MPHNLLRALHIIFLIIIISLPLSAIGQRQYRGVVVDSLTHEPVVGANVVLFTRDSSFVRGTAADTLGVFTLSIPTRTSCFLRISCTGYRQRYIPAAALKRSKTAADTLLLAVNDVTLAGAVVRATRGEMKIEEDTTSFNAEDYNVPEGEALEELIKLLPGVEVDGNNITYNGKVIADFKINGKDFFKGRKGTAMKNLPAELVKRIKTYEKKSDYTEQTGIDDGNEQTVMDIELKKELNESWITSYDAAIGTEGRYIQKAFANRMTDRSRITLNGNMADDDARSDNKSIGADFNFTNGRDKKENGRFELGGRVHASDNRSHGRTWRSSENYTGATQASQFSLSDRYNRNKSSSYGFGARMEWHPDTLTSVIVNTDGSKTHSSGYTSARSARFDADPYADDLISRPLDHIFLSDVPVGSDSAFYKSAINRNENSSKSSTDGYSFSANAMVVRRLNRMGRNVEMDLSARSSEGEGESFRLSDILYFRRKGSRRNVVQDQYTRTPSHSWGYSGRVSYTEPIVRGLNLHVGMSASRSRNRGDRSLYELDSLPSWRDVSHSLGDLPDSRDSLEAVLSYRNSHYSTTNDFNYTGSLSMSWNTRRVNARMGTNVSYHITHMDYRQASIDTTLNRELLRFRPNAFFRYRFSRNEKFEFNYSGHSNDPSMNYRIPTVDNSDALNIHITGVDLKPAWQNDFRLLYNKFFPVSGLSFDANTSLSQSSNDIGTAVTYDTESGVRTTEPKNINGNWSASSNFSMSTPLAFLKGLRLNWSADIGYDHNVGFLSTGRQSSSEKNATRTTRLGGRVNLRYHNEWLEARIGGRMRYRHTDNKLLPSSNMNTRDGSVSGEVSVQLPWRMTAETEMRLNTRRGYSASSMNTNELIWDARLTQRFFRGSPLIVRLQVNDILHRRSNITRTISALGRSDTETDASYSYAMLHLILRLNVFNGKVSSGFTPKRRGNKPKSEKTIETGAKKSPKALPNQK